MRTGGSGILAGALLATFLIIAGLGVPASSLEGGGFDGAVMAELFGRVVDLYVSGRYADAYRYAVNLSSAELPADLGYRHRQVYRLLAEIITLTGRAEELVAEASGLPLNTSDGRVSSLLAELRGLGVRLYGDRLRLGERLGDYVSALKRYVPEDRRGYYYPYLDYRVEVLVEHIDRVLASVRDAVSRLEERVELGGGFEVLGYDEAVDAGSTLTVRVRLSPAPGVERCVLGVRLWLGPFFTVESVSTVPALPNATYKLRVELPDAGAVQGRAPLRYVEELGVYVIEYMGLVYCADEDGRVLGEEYINGTLLLYRPEVTFRAEASVRYGEDLEVEIESGMPVPVNVTVRLDDEAIGNITVGPGKQTFTLESTELSKGYHRLSFEVAPVSRYVGYTFSTTVAVYGVPLRGVVAADRLVPYPLAPLTVRGYVEDAPGSLSLVVVVDGETVYNGTVSPSFEAEVGLPGPLLLKASSVVVMVVPGDPLYDPLVVEVRVFRLNVASVLAASLLALVVGLRGEVGLGPLSRISRAAPLRRAGARVAEYVRLRGLRVSEAARLYWALVSTFPLVFPRPRDSETLREYMARASGGLRETLRSVFMELTLRVELDLYSRRKPGLGEVRRLVEEVRRRLLRG